MMIDATITVGNIIEIAVIAGGGIAALATVKNSVTNFRGEIKAMKLDFIDVKTEIKKVGEVLIKMAVTDQRLANAEQDIRELRHGHGFVQRDINGEYPR